MTVVPQSIFTSFPSLIATLLVMTATGQDHSAPQSRAREVELGTVGKKAETPQLKVFSPYPHIKAKVYHYTDDLRSRFRHALGLYNNNEWKVPIKLNLYGSGNEVHSGRDVLLFLDITPGNEIVLTLEVKIHDRFDVEIFRREFIQLLLVEQMAGAFVEKPETLKSGQLHPPDWLVHGFDHHLKHRQLGKPSYFYSGYLKSGQLLRVRELTKPQTAEGLTPIGLELFRASSAILVGALCEQKNGGESMRGLLVDLAKQSSSDAEVLIRKNFPAFRETDQGIDKWWALQLANLAQQQSFEFFSPAETETYLNSALEVYFPEEKELATDFKQAPLQKSGRVLLEKLRPSGNLNPSKKPLPEFRGSIATYRQFIDRPRAREMVRNRQEYLRILKLKAFPLFHPVIDRYDQVCQKIIEKKYAGIEDELKSIDSLRERIRRSLTQTQDYLNYYEATHSPKRSKVFDNYLKFKDELNSGAFPPRSDPIAIYLDEVERRYFSQ